ncbi:MULTISPECIES: PTS sugar transporter subunit IIA [Olsenella]|uniref:PTS sugar transporter subunit IIA n=1 Tax=Olsenella TaxID=133925 RepID=UPI0007845432|nr:MULTISPECIES: PTS glucose transporter subunit IIA [Olsenella]KXB63987.1 PTS system, glucose subfamily, IIA component [Olsenella sp. DNF00959]
MGLIDTIKRSLFSSGDEAGAPKPAVFHVDDDMVYAPVTGAVVSLGEVHDEAISSGFFGEGCGILPSVGIVYAPATGRISVTAVTNHVIGMTLPGGVEVLIHVGIDTVRMEGKGFTRFVEANDEVAAGTPLIVFDRDRIAAAGYEDVVTVAITNSDSLRSVKNVSSSGTLIGGRPLVKVGDPLLQVER